MLRERRGYDCFQRAFIRDRHSFAGHFLDCSIASEGHIKGGGHPLQRVFSAGQLAADFSLGEAFGFPAAQHALHGLHAIHLQPVVGGGKHGGKNNGQHERDQNHID